MKYKYKYSAILELDAPITCTDDISLDLDWAVHYTYVDISEETLEQLELEEDENID